MDKMSFKEWRSHFEIVHHPYVEDGLFSVIHFGHIIQVFYSERFCEKYIQLLYFDYLRKRES